MGLKEPELGDRQRYEARKGVGGFPQWGGVNKDTDPSGVDAWEFEHLVNVTLSGGSLVSRGGQEQLGSDSAMDGCIYGIIDLGNDSTAGTLLYAQNSLVQQQVIAYNIATDPVDQVALGGSSYQPLPSAWDNRRALFRYGDDILAYSSTAPGSVSKLLTTYQAGVAAVATSLLFSVAHIGGAAESNDVLYLSQNAAGAGNIYSWDGTTLAVDVTGITAVDTMMAAFHETVVVAGVDLFKFRVSVGSWTNVSIPAGMTSFRPLDIVSYKDHLYISGRDEAAGSWASKVLVWDGAALTLANTPTDGTASISGQHGFGIGCTALATFNGLLYYGWSRAQANGHLICYIGKFDGTTWTDTHHNIENSNLVGSVGAMIEYAGNLLLAPLVSYDDVEHLVDYSAGTDTTTWTPVLDANGVLGAALGNDLIVVR